MSLLSQWEDKRLQIDLICMPQPISADDFASAQSGGYLRAQLLFQPDPSTPARPSRVA